MRIRHTCIVVQNMDRMSKFYQDKMRMEVVYDMVETVRVVKLKDTAGNMLELLEYETQSPSVLKSRGISHVAFTIDPEGNYLELVEETKHGLG